MRGSTLITISLSTKPKEGHSTMTRNLARGDPHHRNRSSPFRGAAPRLVADKEDTGGGTHVIRGQRGHWRRPAPSRRGQVTLEEARTLSRTLDSQKIYRNIMCMFTLPVLSWWFEKVRHARTCSRKSNDPLRHLDR